MVLGLFMIVGTGLCWGLSGVLLSYATKKSLDVAAFLLTQTVLSLLMALVMLPDYRAIAV